MTQPNDIDGVLIQWGDRLFYPGNRVVKVRPQPRLIGDMARQHAAAIRARIEATVGRRAQQVMVKVTGGGRGMRGIAAHFRYISKNGRLDIEDELSNIERGKEALRDLVDDWRLGGSRIDEISDCREAFNIMLSMPSGTDPSIVQRAARDFAQAELADHKYVMVLHDHQANPHVHLSVRAESKHGKRLNPRKADLSRWRETFAEKLRGWGISAEATRRGTRGISRNYEPLWRVKARQEGRLRSADSREKVRPRAGASHAAHTHTHAWEQVRRVLAGSSDVRDRKLAEGVQRFLSANESHGREVPQQQSRKPEAALIPQRPFEHRR